MRVTEAEARAVLARWQPTMRLADWDIELRVVTGPWRKSGDVKVDLEDRKAVLLLNAEPRSEDFEETVVHELVHMRLYALDPMLVELLDAVFGAVTEAPRRAFAETRFRTLLASTTGTSRRRSSLRAATPAGCRSGASASRWSRRSGRMPSPAGPRPPSRAEAGARPTAPHRSPRPATAGRPPAARVRVRSRPRSSRSRPG